MPKFKVHYQPEPELSVIEWSWDLLLLVIGIIFWLEVTHFQWITLSFMVLFAVISAFEIFGHQLTVSHHRLVVRNVFFDKWRSFSLGRSRFKVTGHRIFVKDRGRRFCYLVSRSAGRRFELILDRK